MLISGLKYRNTVTWNGAVDIQSGGLTIIGTGDNVTNGAILNVNSASTVTGAIVLRGGDLRLAGGGGRLSEVTSILVSGVSRSISNNTLQGLNLINSAAGGNNTNRISDSASIMLDGGRVTMNGVGAGNYSETLGALSLLGGSNLIYADRNGSTSTALTFQSLTRSPGTGSTIVFDTVRSNTDTGATISFSSPPTLTNGIIGGWAIVSTANGSVQLREFATMSGSRVVAYTPNELDTTQDNWGLNDNVKWTQALGNQTLGSDRSINSLNIQSTAGRTLTINPNTNTGSRTLTIQSGGILAARSTTTFNGGKLTSGTSDLIFYLPTNQLNLNSEVTGAISLVKSGNSVLQLNPNAVRSINRTAGYNIVRINGSQRGGDIQIGAIVTGAGIAEGTTVTSINNNLITISQAPTVSGNSNLTFLNANTYTGKTFLNEGTLQISRESALGTGPASFVADQLTMNGGILRVIDNVAFNDINRGITMGAADGFFRVADNRTLTFGQAGETLTVTVGDTSVLTVGQTVDVFGAPDPLGLYTIDQITDETTLVVSRPSVDVMIDGSGGRLNFAANGNSRGVMVLNGNQDLSGGLETSGAQTYDITGSLSSTFTGGTNIITVATTAGLEVGATVSGDGIEDDTVITRIIDGTTVEISSVTLAGATNFALDYGGFNTLRLTGNNTIGLIRLIGSSIALQGSNVLTDDIIVNSGLLRLGGGNSFGGTLLLTGGVVRFESESGLIAPGGYVLSNQGGEVDLNGFSTTVSEITGSGRVTNEGSGTSSLIVNASSSFSYGGNLSDGVSGGKVALVKNGDGVLTLLSSGSTYTGPTVINEGGILVRSLGFGGRTSTLGSASNAAANLVLDGGWLRFRESASTFSDRSFTLGTGANAGAIIADGTVTGATMTLGFEGLSPAVEFTGVGGRTLTLGGSNRGDNRFDLLLGDGAGGPTSLTKTGNGTWVIGADTVRDATVNNTATIAMSDTSGLREGQQVKGDGIPDGTTILSINPNSSVTLSAAASGTGDIFVSFPGNSYTGETLVMAGILAATVDGAFGSTGGAGVIVAGGTNASAILGGSNATVDLRDVRYDTVLTMYLAGGTLATTVGDSSWAGPIFVTADTNISVDTGASLELKGVIGGNNRVVQRGGGTVILSGQVDPTTRSAFPGNALDSHWYVQTGTLVLDYTANNGDKLSNRGTLVLGGSRQGGRLVLKGDGAVGTFAGGGTGAGGYIAPEHLENVAAVTLSAGTNSIVRESGSAILRMNGINPQAGGTIDFGADDIASTDRVNVNGILGGWATVAGTTWATQSTVNDTNNIVGSTQNRLIRGLANGSYTLTGAFPGPAANDWQTNANMDVIGNSTQNGRSANTLRFHNVNNVAGNNPFTVELTGTNFIQSGGLLFTNNMGAHSGIISGTGTLAITAGNNQNLSIQQNNTGSGLLKISAEVTNNSGQFNGLEKSGVGGLILSGMNTYTGTTTLNNGVLTVNSLAIQGYNNGNTVLTVIKPTLGRTITLFDSTDGLTRGQTVTGTSIPGGVTITAVNAITKVVSLSNGTTYTGVEDLTFGSNIAAKSGTIASNTANNSSVITLAPGLNTQGLTTGQTVSDPDTISPVIPAGAVIIEILNNTQIRIGEIVGNATVAINSLGAANGKNLVFGTPSTLASATQSAALESGSILIVTSTLGMQVGQTITGSGIPGSTTILRILDDSTVELSNPVTSTGQINVNVVGNGATLGGTKVASTSVGSRSVTVGDTSGLSVGQLVTGPGIPEGTTVAAILSGTEVVLSLPVFYSSAGANLVFAGSASNLGASTNLFTNLVFNGGILQYNGTNGRTDRGFTTNENTRFDIGNAYTKLTLAGNFGTQGVEDNYLLIKEGSGTLEFQGRAISGYGLVGLVVNDGRLLLSSTISNQFVRSDIGGLTMGGGILDLRSPDGRSTTQNMIGDLTINEGFSTVTVTATGNQNTVLNLQDNEAPKAISFGQGSTVLFTENQSLTGTGSAIITIAGQFAVDVQTIIPRAVYETNTTISVPGVNHFAFVDAGGSLYNLIGSDLGAAAHTIQGDLANWTAYMNVQDGALSGDAFHGTTPSGASVATIRFYNSSQSVLGIFAAATDPNPNLVTFVDVLGLEVGQVVTGEYIPDNTVITAIDAANSTITLSNPSTATVNTGVPSKIYAFDPVTGENAVNRSTITIADTLTLNSGAILQTTHAGNHVNSIVGGFLTSSLFNSDGASVDLIIHNWNPLTALVIESTIVDNPEAGVPVNLVQSGDGTTALAGDNAYTGTTYVQGGVLRLDSAYALPDASHLRLDGGVVGINYDLVGTATDHFTRALGTGSSQVDWTSGGGFAAYGGVDRRINIGGAGELLTWGQPNFVRDNTSLILGAQDADAKIIFVNDLELGVKSRLVEVISGRAATVVPHTIGSAPSTPPTPELAIPDAIFSGVISGGDGGQFIKGGNGTLTLSGMNTYIGGTVLAEGTLIGIENTSFGSGLVEVGTTTDTRFQDSALSVSFRGTSLGNDMEFGNVNHSGISVLQTTEDATLAGNIAIDRLVDRNVIIDTAFGKSVTYSGDISGTGAFTLIGGGTVTLDGNNSFGTGAPTGVTGDLVIRSGTLLIDSAGALSGSAIRLGDATFPKVDGSGYAVPVQVDFVTSGASLLGVERSFAFIADNRESLGGVFESRGGGRIVSGDADGGAGAFYNISNVIGGVALTSADIGKLILVKDEIDHPERNGVYEVTQFNVDGTMNIARAADFSTPEGLRYGTQVLGPAGEAYFMASPSVTTVNGAFRGGVVRGSDIVDVAGGGLGGTTAGLTVGAEISGDGIDPGTYILEILDGATFKLSKPAGDSYTAGVLQVKGTDPVHWLADVYDSTGYYWNFSGGVAQLYINSAAVTQVSQAILVNNNFGAAEQVITADNYVNFTGPVTLQDLSPGVVDSPGGGYPPALTIESYSDARRPGALVGDADYNDRGLVISGVISEASPADDVLDLVLMGTGTVTLTAANTYQGSTYIEQGTLMVNNTTGSGTGSSDVYVGSAFGSVAALGGSGAIAPGDSKGVYVNSASTLAVGTDNANVVAGLRDTSGQTLGITLTNGILEMAGTLALDLFTIGTAMDPGGSDMLVLGGTGSVYLSDGFGGVGKLQVSTSLDSTTFVVGDNWKLIDWGTLSTTDFFKDLDPTANGGYSTNFIDLPSLNSGLFWDISKLYDLGTITVAVPEPSRWILLLMGMLALGWRRRRSGGM